MKSLNIFIKSIFVALTIVLVIPQAEAGLRKWTASEINSIKTNVIKARNNAATSMNRVDIILKGNIANVASKTRERFNQFDFNFQDSLLRHTVDDTLVFLNSRKAMYLDFIGSSNDKCGFGSPCGNFKEDLRVFFTEMSDLKNRFQFIQKTSFADKDFLLERVENMPPFMLFGMYTALNGRAMETFLEIPSILTEIYDEIDDPDLFSPDFALTAATDEAQEFDTLSNTSPVQQSSLTPAERRAQRQADRQARRDQRRADRQLRRANRRDATTRFCSRLLSRNRGLIDPIRLNRIRLVISFLESVVNSIDGVNPEDIKATGVVAAGGGSALPWYGKVITVVSAQAVSFVGAAVDTRIANLDICRNLP